MKIIKPSYTLFMPYDGEQIIRNIEYYGRTCYKSAGGFGTAEKFVLDRIRDGHESVLEHEKLTVKFTCDRGVSHEIVRHRLASYSQESTRYCNYADERFGEELTFIRPCYWEKGTPEMEHWEKMMSEVERLYMALIHTGSQPQQARCILPNSLKTELIMTANMREWRHFLKLRTARDAHPQMRELTVPLLKELQEKVPIMFDDI